MASNKDILEAQRFNRRRLVTAFSSGTPGGKELEPRSHTGALFAGVGLTLLLMLIAAILGRFAPQLPSGWENGALVVEQDSGARYFSVEGVLRPVRNTASARLLSPSGQFQVVKVPGKALVGVPRGSEVGIPDAPDALPTSQQLESLRWSSCATGEGQTHTWIGEPGSGHADAGTAVVTNAGKTYVISHGRRHLLDSGRDDVGVLLALGLDTAHLHPVQADWLDLFPMGSDLRALTLTDAGLPVSGMPARLQTAVVGSVIQVEEGASQRRYLVIGDGTITPLSDTAFRLAQAGLASTASNPLTASVGEISALKVEQTPEVPTDWPASFVDAIPETHRACARLLVEGGNATTVVASLPAPQPDAVATTPSEQPGVTVEGGSGALVRASSGGTLGAVVLVSDLGIAHGLTGDTADTLSRLGYTGDDVITVPAPWVALVPPGPSLSAEEAQRTVKAS